MDEKINVCLLNESFPPVIDGVANAVLNYADIIQRNYGNAVVVAPRYPGIRDDYPYRVVRHPSINTLESVGFRVGIPYWPGTIRELVKCNIDIIHTHSPFVSTLVARSLRASINAPIILTYHTKFDIAINNAVASGILRSAAIKFIISNIEACDEVWVVSEGAGENLKNLGYKGSYLLMENGADFPRGRAATEEIDAISAAYQLESDVPVFLFVGRMMWYKGIRIILDGLCGAKSQGLLFKMIFVGDGGDFEEIRECAKILGLSDDIIFTGFVGDRKKLRALFSRADMFLFPSTFDTNGLVVREAAACSLASVLIKGSCAAEGITDGRHGVLINEDAASLADAIVHLASNRGSMKAMGKHAMEEIYVTWEDAVERAAERYHVVRENYQSAKIRRFSVQKALEAGRRYFKHDGEILK